MCKRSTSAALVVVSGIDGAGKSTLLRGLAARRPDWQIGSYEPADWLPQPELPHFEWALAQHPRHVVAGLSPRARSAFFVDMIVSHWEYWVAPRLERDELVVLDSFYHRFMIKEELRGRSTELMRAAFEELPNPDLVLLTRTPLAIGLGRKKVLDANDVESSASPADYLSFQQRLLARLVDYLGERSVPTVAVDGSRAPAEVAADAEREIVDALAAVRA